MTRQHFKALAENLRSIKPFWPTLACEVTPTMVAYMDKWIDCVRVVANTCKQFNSGFKPDRFYTACGYDPDEVRAQVNTEPDTDCDGLA